MQVLAGVYAIVHVPTGRRYIGSTIDLRNRLNNHRFHLSRNSHANKRLQRAWNKFGAEDFEFLVVERANAEELLDREQYYLDLAFPNVFNSGKRAERPSLGRKLNATQKRIFAEARKHWWAQHPEFRQKQSARLQGHAFNVGRKASMKTRLETSVRMKQWWAKNPEQRRRHSIKARGNKGRAGQTHTRETIAKIAAIKTGKSRPWTSEWRAKIAASLRGRKISPEALAKRVGRKHSEETRAKMRMAQQKRFCRGEVA